MQLTRLTDYALRTLMYVGSLPNDQRGQISDVAAAFDIARSHMVKVVHQLGKAGFIRTVRGKGGGFSLAMPADQIRIGDVVRYLEPNLAPANCVSPPCLLRNNCLLNQALLQARDAFLEHLDTVSLADLLTPAQKVTLRQVIDSTSLLSISKKEKIN
jgi:Rrf2 family nitric oxide-sensitive transcriptional repressor